MDSTLVVVTAVTAMTSFIGGGYFSAKLFRPPTNQQSRDTPNTSADLRAIVRLVRELLPLFITPKNDDGRACNCACHQPTKVKGKGGAGNSRATKRRPR